MSSKQVEKLKYPLVAFTSDERKVEELDVRSGKASAVIHPSVFVKRELSKKTMLSCGQVVISNPHLWPFKVEIQSKRTGHSSYATNGKFMFNPI